jgi:hypothetical protein
VAIKFSDTAMAELMKAMGVELNSYGDFHQDYLEVKAPADKKAAKKGPAAKDLHPEYDWTQKAKEKIHAEIESMRARKSAAAAFKEEHERDEELKKTLGLLVQMAKKHGSSLSDPGVGRSLEERVAKCLHTLDAMPAGIAMGGTFADKVKYCEGWTSPDTTALNNALHEIDGFAMWSPTRPYGGPMKDEAEKKGPPKAKLTKKDVLAWIDEGGDLEAGLKPASEHAPDVELNELVEHQLMTADPAYGAF